MAALAPRLRWGGRDRRVGLLVLSGLVAFVGSIYLIALGLGGLVGEEGTPSVGLSVIATAIVALGFEPVRKRLQRMANWALHGTASSPDDVLRRFSETATGRYDGDEIPAEMSKLLAEGTGARWAQVWLVVADRLSLSATWPVEADAVEEPPDPSDPMDHTRDAVGPRRRSLAVRQDGELLGVLRLEEHDDRPLTTVEERLFAGLAAQAGLVLRSVRLRAELAYQLEQLSDRADELQRSRRRLISAHDDERTKLERDIHDGAQQHLVALTVNLRLALNLLAKSSERAARLLEEQAGAAEVALETLEQLSRGIYPRRLIDEGLAAALRSVTAASTLQVSIVDRSAGRPAPDVEAALYFCCLEALQNTAKHANAEWATVEVDVALDGAVQLVIEDDGRGFDPDRVRLGAGLANIRDRVDAVGGSLDLRSAPRAGTRLEIRVPARRPAAVVD
jgi:signal transduction histidine kinase